MNILLESVSKNVDLNMQGIDTSDATTFAQVISIILERRRKSKRAIVNHNKNPGKKALKFADTQPTSINLPLRSAIVQQVQLSNEELQVIQKECEQAITSHKIAQLAAGKQNIDFSQSTHELGEWMEPRITKALQLKVERAIQGLIGKIPLIGFQNEEKVETILKQRLAELVIEEEISRSQKVFELTV